jgi:hypothetical protein
MTLRSEVGVLDWGPDRGNPTSMRQGRGSEFTGRLAGACSGWWASVRAGLKEAVDALWWRTEVKRRKAFLGWGELACGSDALFLSGDRGRIGDAITTKSQRFTPGDLLGSGTGCWWAGGRKDEG